MARTNGTTAETPSFALWDLETGNLVGAYDTEDAALTIVNRSITEHGRGSVAALALARETSRGVTNIAQGDSLAERALAAVSVLLAKPA